jgi:hypothetical protein
MITKNEILTLVKQYNETNDLDTFAHSFVPLFYDIEDSGDAEAIQFAYQIESTLAAMTAGVCSEAAFQSAMKALSPSLSIVFGEVKMSAQTPVLFGLFKAPTVVETVQLAYVGIAPSVGFGSKTDLTIAPQTNTTPLPWQQMTAE